MSRHDARRSGLTTSTSNIDQPAAYWRYFAGGAIGSRGMLAVDVDADGTREIVLLTGGRLEAKRAVPHDIVNQTLWKGPALGLLELIGSVDLDDDGREEIVARSVNQVFVVGTADGQVLWAEPVDEMGTIGGVRLADLDGDDVADLFIQECGCCSVNSGKTGFAYRFAGNGASMGAPVLLWTLPSVACGGYDSMSIGRMAQGGEPQVVLATDTALSLLAASDAALLATTGPIGANIQRSRCLPVDVDADGAEELLCVLSDAAAPDGIGRLAFLVRYAATPSPSLSVAWQQLVGDVAGAVVVAPGAVADMDGSGSVELAVTGRDSGGQLITYLYDARLGTLLGHLYGQEVAGLAPVGPAGRAVLLTQADGDLFAWAYVGQPSPQISLAWTMANRRVATQVDFDAARRSNVAERPVTLDLDGDGVQDLVTIEGSAGLDLAVHSCSSGSPQTLGDYAPGGGTSILRAWGSPTVEGAGARLVVAQSDGNLHALDANLEPAGGTPDHGVRFGGYYSPSSFRQLQIEPVVGSLGSSQAQAIVVSTSRGAIERLDAAAATFAQGPPRIWTRDHSKGAAIVPGLAAGQPGVMAILADRKDQESILAMSADGGALWQADLPGITLTDVVPAPIDGDGTTDVYVQWGRRDDAKERPRALSGLDGHVLWDGGEFGLGNRQPAGAAAADWNGDGLADLVFQADATVALSAMDGSSLATSPPGGSYAMPMLIDVDGDAQDEAILHADYYPLRALDHDLQTVLWESNDDDRPYPYAARAECSGAPHTLVSSSWQNPSRLKLSLMNGPNAGSYQTVVLAGGSLYPDEASAQQAGGLMGQLASPVVHGDLAGDGIPVALVGSSDGWLYGLEACSGSLRFAVDLGAPVGSVVLGDTDGDGFDEILASVADGYLYGLDQAVLGAPGWVYDTDPPHGVTNEDVDEIETGDTLYAAWAEVPDADSYAVAVVRDEFAGGGYVTDPPWLPVGNVTKSDIPYLELEDGARYFVGVRGVKGGEVSPDAISDGVVVHLEGLPTEPDRGDRPANAWLTGRSCVYFCTVGPPGAGKSPWLCAAALLAVTAARRVRRRHRVLKG